MFDAEVNLEGISKADMVVGIPSYSEADAIRYPTIQASEGLFRYFPDKKSVIVNCDNNSPDNTKQIFLETKTRVPKIYLSTLPGVRGKGNNLRNLFRKAVDLEAKAIIVIDADLKSITPEWIKRLGAPLYSGFSYVAPLYISHRHDRAITNAIAYPMFRALYGRRIRQPMGREFGFSGELARAYMESPIWDDSVAHDGIQIWMTTLALTHGAKVCQSFMGSPRIHRPKDAIPLFVPRVERTVGTIFILMSQLESHWLELKYSRPTAVIGFGQPTDRVPPQSGVDTQRLFLGFQDGFFRFEGLWGEVFAKDLFSKLREIKGMKQDILDFPTDLWARILYDVAVACRDRMRDSHLLVTSLIPLFWGKIFSFSRKTISMGPHQVEAVIEEDCMTFEMTKPYLVKKWQEGRKPAKSSHP